MLPPGVVGLPGAVGLFLPRTERPLCRLVSSGAASSGNLDWQSSHCQKEDKHPTLYSGVQVVVYSHFLTQG